MVSTGFLDDSDSGDDPGGVELTNGTFKVNEDYARKFDYNKKREEIRHLEDKIGASTRKRKREGDHDADSGSDVSSDSESEDEDDEGELATEALDSEIIATLNAIRSKDPRVYDQTTTFYTEPDEEPKARPVPEMAKPMFLRDYHRENLLNGVSGADGEEPPKTYDQEQADLKASIVKEIHATADEDSDVEKGDQDDDSDAGAGFLKTKEKPEKPKKKDSQRAAELHVEDADKDPETFLSNFMSSRAWAANERSQLQPFESDDEDEEKRAEAFEEAYNFRFEDPAKSNEKLMSHARDLAAKYSVRREEPNPRKKHRETEREKKETAKKQLGEEKARLRKLKIEEAEEKIRRIKRAAGLRGKTIDEKDWSKFLDEGWDDSKWDGEMQKRFGDEYYNDEDAASENTGSDAESSKERKKLKKPKWDDDIDIKDLVPDFVEEDEADFSLSDDDDGLETEKTKSSKKSSKRRKLERSQQKKDSRLEHQRIEKIVDDQLKIETSFLPGSTSQQKAASFRYRETSPTSYGLSARDILMADDSQLNEFAGLKKLATFRDAEKKRKDQKRLGKKARLRKWRKDTFGDEDGPRDHDFVKALMKEAEAAGEGEVDADDGTGGADIREGGGKKKKKKKKKKRKRSKKNQGGVEL